MCKGRQSLLTMLFRRIW